MSKEDHPSAIEWVRRPQQDRSQKTLDRLLDATERLLAKKSFEEVSVADIVKEAKSSVGSFYARFPDKESILFGLQERLYLESRHTAAAALSPESWQGVTLDDLVRTVTRFMIVEYRQREGLRIALIREIARNARFRERAAALATDVSAQLTTLLASRAGEIAHPNLPLAVDVCHRIVFSVLDQHLLFGALAPAGTPLSDETLTEEIAAACLAYLKALPGAPRPPKSGTKKKKPATKKKTAKR